MSLVPAVRQRIQARFDATQARHDTIARFTPTREVAPSQKDAVVALADHAGNRIELIHQSLIMFCPRIHYIQFVSAEGKKYLLGNDGFNQDVNQLQGRLTALARRGQGPRAGIQRVLDAISARSTFCTYEEINAARSVM